jgi:L-aspartate oxidase
MSTSTSATSPRIREGAFPDDPRPLLELGIDMTKEPIPVVPAQHYTCGGVMIDLDGRTDLPGLYAAGECTESGLHGANRLASNSAARMLRVRRGGGETHPARWENSTRRRRSPWDESRVTDSDEEVVIKQNWTEIRRFMWNYVGIVRTTKRLERAKHRIDLLTPRLRNITALSASRPT